MPAAMSPRLPWIGMTIEANMRTARAANPSSVNPMYPPTPRAR